METTLRIHTKVLPGHRIEIVSPELRDGDAVDVLVVCRTADGAESTEIDARQLLKLPLQERDRILSAQAERMVEYYNATEAEREEWQGGDIIDE